MNIVTNKWDEIIHKLKIEHGLSDVSFKTWISPLEVYDVVDIVPTQYAGHAIDIAGDACG